MEKSFTVGNVFSRSFDIFGKNFVFMLLIAFISVVPGVLQEVSDPGSGMVFLAVVGNFILSIVLEGIVVYGVFQHLTGRRMELEASFAVAMRRIGYILLVSLVMGMLVGFGLLLLIVPGVIALVILWVAVPVTVVEKGGVNHALRRSAELTKGNRGTVFAVVVLTALLSGVASGVQFGLFQVTLGMGLVPG